MSAAESAVREGCRVLNPGQGAGTLPGRQLEILLATMEGGQCADSLARHSGRRGEEVAAVLGGRFRVEAAGEVHELVQGQAIIIPAGEPRRWFCIDGGKLYRVIRTVGEEVDEGA